MSILLILPLLYDIPFLDDKPSAAAYNHSNAHNNIEQHCECAVHRVGTTETPVDTHLGCAHAKSVGYVTHGSISGVCNHSNWLLMHMKDGALRHGAHRSTRCAQVWVE